MARSPRRRWPTALVVCVVATLARIILFRDVTLSAVANAAWDDRLYIELAGYIEKGLWLGDYTIRTLAKGPGYPIFIALSGRLGLPLHLAHQLFYIGACAALAIALRPIARNAGWAAALYVTLLFSPMSWEMDATLRVLRQAASIPSMMLFVAAVAGCLFATNRWTRFAWAAVGGLSAAMTWLTREESVWVAPMIVILAAAPFILRGRVASPRTFYFGFATILGTAAMLIVTVGALNRVSYGVYTIVEIRERSFVDAIGALMRVNPSERLPTIAVTRKSREMVYGISPAFRELRPWLEGSLGETAVRDSQSIRSIPGTEGEILAGWFNFLMKDAMQRTGHHDTPLEASAFFRRVADDINLACDRGQIPCGPRRSGLMPPIDGATILRFAEEFGRITRSVIVLPGVYDRIMRSSGAPSNLKMFASVSRSPLAPTDRDSVSAQSLIRGRIASIYRGAALLMVSAALPLLWLSIRRQLRSRQITTGALVTVASGSALVSGISLLALAAATSFPVTLPGYVATVYPFFLLTSWALVHEGLRRDGALLSPSPVELSCSSREGRLLHPPPHRTGLADFPHPARQRKVSQPSHLVE